MKKKDAVTWTRTHIHGIDRPPSEPLGHKPIQIADKTFTYITNRK